MPEATLKPCAYHVIRYMPNLVRDEWVNVGVLVFDPASGRMLRRVVEEPAEMARVRRLHPARRRGAAARPAGGTGRADWRRRAGRRPSNWRG